MTSQVKFTGLFYIFLTFALSIPSQKVRSQSDPLNSNYLIENGVSPEVLDLAANTTLLDAKFVQRVELVITQPNGETETYELGFIYDPQFEYGLDLRVISSGLSKKETKFLKTYIEKSHSFSRLSERNLYDESTLKVIDQEGTSVVLEYMYQKRNIDPYLKHIKRLKGTIYFENQKLNKIVLQNFKPLKSKISDYERTVYFERAIPGGGHIPVRITETFNQTTNNGMVRYQLTSTSEEITTFDDQMQTWAGKEQSDWQFELESVDTLSVKLGWFLPLLGKPATKLGYKLPRPIGLNIFMHYQTQLMQFTDLQVGINDEDLVSFGDFFALENSSVDQNTFVNMAKVDVWILPFLNIMGIYGQGDNSIDGQLFLDEEFRQALIDYGWLVDLDPNSIPEAIDIVTKVSSRMYGGGLTLAGGVGNWNLALNYQLMFAELTEVNTTQMANVFTPTVGYMTDIGLNIMAGAQGQFYDTQVVGFINLEDGNVLNYQVDFEPVRWNFLVGFYKGFAKHWEVAIQGGFGDRESLTAVFGYRF